MYSLAEFRPEVAAEVYSWLVEEPNMDHFSCRPQKPLSDLETWTLAQLDAISGGLVVSCLIDDTEGRPLARFTAFDYNPRNRSAEIGYFMPAKHRGKGLGTRGLGLFLAELFSTKLPQLHKVYATTSRSNDASRRILEKCGFHLDGALREHYLIDGVFHDQLIFSLLKRDHAGSL